MVSDVLLICFSLEQGVLLNDGQKPPHLSIHCTRCMAEWQLSSSFATPSMEVTVGTKRMFTPFAAGLFSLAKDVVLICSFFVRDVLLIFKDMPLIQASFVE